MRRLSIFFFVAGMAPAQIFSYGVKAGVPVSQTEGSFGNNSDSLLSTGRWTIGPTFELRLVYGFSVETEALYRGYSTLQSFGSPSYLGNGAGNTIVYPPLFISYRTNTDAVDIPLLLKYRIGSRSFHPFVDAGYTWTPYHSNVTGSDVCLASPAECAAANTGSFNLFHYHRSGTFGGPSAGAGVEFRWRWLKISPEVRYSHHSNPNSNQTEVLVGFTH